MKTMDAAMTRVLIAGDSLSMTRHADGVSYEDIYPVRLQIDLPRSIVVNASVRGNCSEAIASDPYLTEYLLPLRPDHVVVQLGIVDCTPRLFRRREKLVLSAMQRIAGLRTVSNAIIRTASCHRYALTRRRRLCQVKPEDFERHVRSFAAAARRANGDCTFTLINIPRPGAAHVRANYRVEEIVRQYNGIIADLARDLSADVIDLHGYTERDPSAVLADGYHLSPAAHAFIHGQLASRLRRLGTDTEP